MKVSWSRHPKAGRRAGGRTAGEPQSKVRFVELLFASRGSERGSLSGAGKARLAAASTSAPAPCDPPRGWEGQGRRIHLGGKSSGPRRLLSERVPFGRRRRLLVGEGFVPGGRKNR